MAATVPQTAVPTPVPNAPQAAAQAVPGPRMPPGEETCAGWYERVLGWTVLGTAPARLATGTRFDALELPSDAGAALLRRPVPTGPVALAGHRMYFLVAAGGAEELDGLLDWLEWGGVALDLAALGADGRMTAPAPPGTPLGKSPRGAAVWLRPPEQGCEALLPALPGPGRAAGPARGPDLVRLVAAAATECHRARLRRRTPLREAAGQRFS
ncbi:SCO3374 family protein [Streptomyces sp. NPDC056367]|uniref:SCO3374 family protein n=1 Tax=unclassified Streptomyces TaxID=2593676 RepID=UPI0035DE1ED4